jgi:hypothetical protein
MILQIEVNGNLTTPNRIKTQHVTKCMLHTTPDPRGLVNTFGFHKKRGIFLIAEQPLISQKELSSMRSNGKVGSHRRK